MMAQNEEQKEDHQEVIQRRRGNSMEIVHEQDEQDESIVKTSDDQS